MKKILISAIVVFSSLNCYAENVIGDPPIDEPTNEMTIEQVLQMPLHQISQILNEKDEKGEGWGLPNNIYSELQKMADVYNNRGKGILLELINKINYNSNIFCNLNRKDFQNEYVYEPKNIRITCDDSIQTLITRLNELKFQTKDWEPRYSFSKYKWMTLLELAEELQEGIKTKEFDTEDLREDFMHFLTEEYGNFGYVLTDQGVLKAVGTCLLAKETGTIHRKEVKKFCNLTVKETIKGLLE